jgi:hypothetical protein
LPAYRHRTVLDIGRDLSAFLDLHAGFIRGELRDPEHVNRQLEQAQSRVEQLQEQLVNSTSQLQQVRQQLSDKDRQLEWWRKRSSKPDIDPGSISPENVVWIFGAPRTGSTWLSDMMEDGENKTVWREPTVGALFGIPYYAQGSEALREARYKNMHFILGRHREAWLRAVRFTVLDGAAARFPNATQGGGHLIIKEPNGSMGAPLLMEALPESRMIVLMRDPRDALASALDARREDGWWSNKEDSSTAVEACPDRFMAGLAKTFVLHMGNAKKAYDAHRGRKVMVRYEDLRSDTLGEMERIYSTLEIAVDKEELAQVVEKHSWEMIPADEKGEGKFYRKASPGSWTEDLTPQQVEIIERITGPLLKEFYS